jgi:hypothetical protein
MPSKHSHAEEEKNRGRGNARTFVWPATRSRALRFEDRAHDLYEVILHAYGLIDPHRGKDVDDETGHITGTSIAFDPDSEIELLRERLGAALEIAFKLCDLYNERDPRQAYGQGSR